MKLAYIYIQNHRVLENIDIPISGSHKCSYSDEKLFLNFFPNDLNYYQGVDCSAIIGKNGVGKSTILDFLEVAYEGTDSSGIIVWFDNSEKKYHICAINLYLNENSIQSNQDYILERDLLTLTKRNKVKLVKANNLTGVENNDFLRKRKNNSFVYDLSLSQYVRGSRKVIAQRTNRLISYFSSSESFNKVGRPKVKFDFKFSYSSKAYLKSLLVNEQFSGEYIEPRGYLTTLRNFCNDDINVIGIYHNDKFMSNLIELNILSICNYLSKLKIIRKINRDKLFIQLIIGMVNGLINQNYLIDVLLKLNGESKFESDDIVLKSDSFIILEEYNLIISKFNNISSFMEYYPNDFEWNDRNNISTYSPSFIIKMTNYILDLPLVISNNFIFGWSGFSTGEFAKANLFSELYYYIYNQKQINSSNHLIVMDEVDLYLHPDWQRTFFSELLEFIKIEFPKDSVQIILSTHSPIIISDFLPEDIVSLDREKGVTKVVESFGFATHITDLYVEGMHLNSTFGEHSKKAINQLIVRSKDKSLTDNDIALIEKIKSKNIQQMILSTYDKN